MRRPTVSEWLLRAAALLLGLLVVGGVWYYLRGEHQAEGPGDRRRAGGGRRARAGDHQGGRGVQGQEGRARAQDRRHQRAQGQPARAGPHHGPDLARAARAALARQHERARRPTSSSRARPSTPTPIANFIENLDKVAGVPGADPARHHRKQRARSTASSSSSTSQSPSRRRRQPAAGEAPAAAGGAAGAEPMRPVDGRVRGPDWRSQAALGVSPGTSALGVGLVLARALRARLVAALRPARSTQIAAQGRRARRAAGQDPGRPRRQAASCRSSARRCGGSSSSSTSCCASCRRAATPPDLLRRIRALDRAGRLRPPALHARQLHRPRLLQRVADPDRSCTGTYHNLALFFDRISRFSRIINVENLRSARSPHGAQRAHDHAPTSSPRPSSTEERRRRRRSAARRRPRGSSPIAALRER